MTATTKSALLLAVTLLLGVVIGLAGAGALERRPPRGPTGPGGRGRPGGLEQHMMETIQPRDAAQVAQVRPIVARAAARNRQIIAGVNTSLRASIDSMKSELAPVLDDAQRARLDEVTRALPPLRGPPPGRP